MPSTKNKTSLRLRIFAGPNGSGKSTIIKVVREYKIKNKLVDFGIYVNADDIAELLRSNKFSFAKYQLKIDKDDFRKETLASGLINESFSDKEFFTSYTINRSKLLLKKRENDERIAQIIADYLRKKLLTEKKKFSFETVFSHRGKLEIMKAAVSAGYKVYLYFVSTESPEINKDRVELRVVNKGHGVEPEKIVSRYYRSLGLLHDAAQLAYQAYFFDNSGTQPKLFAHFKKIKEKKKWDKIEQKQVPDWFITYYSSKVKK